MTNQQKQLIIQQMDKKLAAFKYAEHLIPERGWIKAIRTSLNMTVRQFAKRLGFTPGGASDVESREATGSITLKSLEEAGRALDMKLVYGFVPIDGSLSNLIEKRAWELAKEIVLSTSQTMALEDQENSKERIQKAIEEKAEQFVRELPRHLWD